jgi:uncharacterized hydrophobic protein (TIGR00271 family)
MAENPEDNKQEIPENKASETGTNQGTPNRESDPTKIHFEKNPVEIVTGTLGFFRSILSLRDGEYDIPEIIKSVREGILFKGYNVWVLMCSIVVASVGLNINSTAVIIGAMLISPLMGPIKGIGFGVGINDFKLLTESLKNFGVTVAISLTISVLYFLISPINTITDEIWSRTEPSFLDVIIAFFGGLAGVIAHSKGKNDTVIPGVAIATALMPPLCTAGFGLAHGDWNFFFGAGYLFILNSILIATSTYLFIRYLKFPKKEYVNPKIEKRVRVYTLTFIVIVLAPSGYMFYKMTHRSIFESNATKFVEEVIQNTDTNMTVTPKYNFDWDNSVISLAITNYYADPSTIEMWNRQKKSYELEDVTLSIKQNQDVESMMDKKLSEYDNQNRGANTLAQLISQKENQIIALNNRIKNLEDNPIIQKDPLELNYLLAGFKIDYPEYRSIYVNRSFSLNAKNTLDTTYIMSVEFKEVIPIDQKKSLNAKLSKRFLFQLKEKTNCKQDSVQVFTLN